MTADTPSRFVRALGATEQEELAQLEREQPPSLGRRAQAILLSARREPIPAIMRRLGVSRPPVTAWLTRFEAAWVAGLRSRRGPAGRRS